MEVDELKMDDHTLEGELKTLEFSSSSSQPLLLSEFKTLEFSSSPSPPLFLSELKTPEFSSSPSPPLFLSEPKTPEFSSSPSPPHFFMSSRHKHRQKVLLRPATHSINTSPVSTSSSNVGPITLASPRLSSNKHFFLYDNIDDDVKSMAFPVRSNFSNPGSSSSLSSDMEELFGQRDMNYFTSISDEPVLSQRSGSNPLVPPNFKLITPESSPSSLGLWMTHKTDKASEPISSQRSGSNPLLPPNLSLVLVGKTGSGKSSSGNTILGRTAFNAMTRSKSVTQRCSKESGEVAGRNITVVDTPGLFDPDRSQKELTEEFSKCLQLSAPGPDAIILVIQLGPSIRKKRPLEKIKTIFGEEAVKYTMILFTHGDELQNTTIDEYVQDAHPKLREILNQCGGRYHVFNNNLLVDRVQVLEFLEKVDRMQHTFSHVNDLEKALCEVSFLEECW